MVPIFGATAVIALVAFSVWFLLLEGPAPSHRRRLMPRFLSYYRQFDELSPEEISQSLRERREEELRREVATQPELDLSGAAWHGPPHAEIINAATFALRRAVNAYPDAAPLRAALATAHDVEPDARSSSATVRASCCGPPCAPSRGATCSSPGRAGARCRAWSARRARGRSR